MPFCPKLTKCSSTSCGYYFPKITEAVIFGRSSNFCGLHSSFCFNFGIVDKIQRPTRITVKKWPLETCDVVTLNVFSIHFHHFNCVNNV